MIRKLTPADAPEFMRLRRESFRKAPLSFEQTGDIILQPSVILEQLRITDHQFVLGYFSKTGRLLGIMALNRYEPVKRQHRSYLWGVYLNEEIRGQGIAGQLLTEVIAEARAMDGLERIILTVSNHAKGALKLYKKAGFTEFGREPDAARTGDIQMDEIYMLLEL